MEKWLKNGIHAIFSAALIAILGLILFSFDDLAFFCKRSFLFPQWGMLLGGVAALALLQGLADKRRSGRRPKGYEAIVWLLLLAAQLVCCFHAYFITGWDASEILAAAYRAAGGEAVVSVRYFGLYPNNLALVWLFGLVIRAFRWIAGNPGLDRCVFVLIAGQCLLNTLTGFVCHTVVKRATRDSRMAWFASIVYIVFIGVSPWLMIPYSDSMGLIFPALVLLLYQNCRDKAWGWLLMSAAAAAGYLIKPQAAIVMIAIVMVEFIRQMSRRRLLAWVKGAFAAACVMVLLIGIGSKAVRGVLPGVDPRRNVGMMHFAMMGLNQKTNGVYSYEDVVFSSNIESPEERRDAQLARIKERLASMTAGDMASHIKKKTLTNYADGTFAWGCEGEFYAGLIEDKDDVLSPFLKSLIDTGNERYQILQTAFQSIWLALLLGCAVYGILFWGKADDIASVIMLSIIGLTLFELIFEARARYLYIYAPYYVMLGSMGIRRAMNLLKGKKRA